MQSLSRSRGFVGQASKFVSVAAQGSTGLTYQASEFQFHGYFSDTSGVQRLLQQTFGNSSRGFAGESIQATNQQHAPSSTKALGANPPPNSRSSQGTSIPFSIRLLVAAIPLLACVGVSFADAPRPWQFGFQDPATAMMEGIIDLHHDIMFFMWIIATFYLYMLLRTVQLFRKENHPKPVKLLYNTKIEIIWTLVPCAILAIIAVSSFALLYSEEIAQQKDDYTGLTVKVTGRQWYWQYDYPAFMEDFDGDSYMVASDDLEPGMLYNLEVDNRLILPANTPVRLIITAGDVLHSWAVPSLGIKCDAVPGRLNQVNTIIKRPGIFYGQCSELCGAVHFGMPICVVAIPPDDDLWN